VTPEDAAAVLDIVEQRQADLLSRLGTRLIYAADEFYLATGRPFPPAEAYEGFPQKENGIGLARLFLDEIRAVEIPAGITHRRVTLATGTLAAPLLEMFAARLREKLGIEVQVLPVPNRFYGGGVSVAGLLTGSDLIAALTGQDLGDMLLLPAVILNSDGVFLDDMTPEEVEAALHIPLRFCANAAEVVEGIGLFTPIPEG